MAVDEGRSFELMVELLHVTGRSKAASGALEQTRRKSVCSGAKAVTINS
jgi:hypothetical protein